MSNPSQRPRVVACRKAGRCAGSPTYAAASTYASLHQAGGQSRRTTFSARGPHTDSPTRPWTRWSRSALGRQPSPRCRRRPIASSRPAGKTGAGTSRVTRGVHQERADIELALKRSCASIVSPANATPRYHGGVIPSCGRRRREDADRANSALVEEGSRRRPAREPSSCSSLLTAGGGGWDHVAAVRSALP